MSIHTFDSVTRKWNRLLQVFSIYIEGMTEEMKSLLRQENEFTVTRDGDCFVDKAKVGGVDFEIRLPINKEIEWKEKDESPIFHIKVVYDLSFVYNFVRMFLCLYVQWAIW